MAAADLTAARLRELLHYDPETGVFTWLVTRGPAKAGDTAGTVNKRGYRYIGLDGHHYRAHRLAWLYMTWNWPNCQIDHRDGYRDNNRIENLRDVAAVINSQNQRDACATSTSQLIGASRHARSGRWISTIRVNGKKRRIGLFDTAEAAHLAYVDAKRKLHPGCTI